MNFLRSSAALLSLGCALVAAAQSAPPAPASAPNPLAAAQVFAYEQMPVRTMANGGEGRNVVSGTLATGESVNVHESMQPAGATPNPAHRIQHSEFIVVQQGTLEFIHDGKTERATAGSVIYVAFGTLHGVKNVGDVPAKYIVIAIGGDIEK